MRFTKSQRIFRVSIPTLPLQTQLEASSHRDALQKVLNQAYGQRKKQIERVKYGNYNAVVDELGTQNRAFFKYVVAFL